jgi:hypothetical protein
MLPGGVCDFGAAGGVITPVTTDDTGVAAIACTAQAGDGGGDSRNKVSVDILLIGDVNCVGDADVCFMSGDSGNAGDVPGEVISGDSASAGDLPGAVDASDIGVVETFLTAGDFGPAGILDGVVFIAVTLGDAGDGSDLRDLRDVVTLPLHCFDCAGNAGNDVTF